MTSALGFIKVLLVGVSSFVTTPSYDAQQSRAFLLGQGVDPDFSWPNSSWIGEIVEDIARDCWFL
jgi:hypothetical protein